MKIINLIDEDFLQFKYPTMFIGLGISCSGKCWRELNLPVDICQNHMLNKTPLLDVDVNTIIKRYMSNPLTKAIVLGGLEPLDNFDNLTDFIKAIRQHSEDIIVIYTGYNEDEAKDKIKSLKYFKNIIIKFGRYIPNKPRIFDSVLGLELASDNQYAKKIS